MLVHVFQLIHTTIRLLPHTSSYKMHMCQSVMSYYSCLYVCMCACVFAWSLMVGFNWSLLPLNLWLVCFIQYMSYHVLYSIYTIICSMLVNYLHVHNCPPPQGTMPPIGFSIIGSHFDIFKQLLSCPSLDRSLLRVWALCV